MKPRILILLSCFVLCFGQMCGAPPPIDQPPDSGGEGDTGESDSTGEDARISLSIPPGLYVGLLGCARMTTVTVLASGIQSEVNSTFQGRWSELFGDSGLPLTPQGQAITIGYDRAYNEEGLSMVVASITPSADRLEIIYAQDFTMDMGPGVTLLMQGSTVDTYILQPTRDVLLERTEHLSGSYFDQTAGGQMMTVQERDCSALLARWY